MYIDKGYILIARKMYESDVMELPPVTRELWLYILAHANHSDNGRFKRGECFLEFNKVIESLSWYAGYRRITYKKPDLTKSLRRLNERNMIETTKATRGVFVKVLQYDLYQAPGNYESNDEDETKETRKKRHGITKNKNDKNAKNEKFIIPTVREVQDYCKQRGNNIDANRFVDYYESNGWKVGRNPMKDWKASIRTWENKQTPDSSKSEFLKGVIGLS